MSDDRHVEERFLNKEESSIIARQLAEHAMHAVVVTAMPAKGLSLEHGVESMTILGFAFSGTEGDDCSHVRAWVSIVVTNELLTSLASQIESCLDVR